ncbi:hypothetical protein POF51_29655 [Brevibacillus sp. AG]|uniref:hypothetical protein n=1 Tax=Brevibacillus sp. AG TaxID=3020891 RepID=UPI00232ABC83|nr:hypothetical protein [Brevibacillus sp. AG]MDC0764890.1 hypothetical protein [Brevibacillus sp. AG]
MEVAYWLHGQIDIQTDRIALANEGHSWPSIYKALEEKYRIHQRKRLLYCQCCDAPVEMVLNKDRACFFRHPKGISCPGSENYQRYTGSRALEHEQRFRVGKQIIRTYLESVYAPRKIQVKDGYTYRQKLQHVPDLVVPLPDGRVLSIDYLTGLKSNDVYRREIIKRIEGYTQQGFISYFLIDNQWMSREGQYFLSLSDAENILSGKSEKDIEWENFMNSLLKVNEGSYLKQFIGYEVHLPFEVMSLHYIDIDERTVFITRYTPLLKQGWGYLPVGSTSLRFEDFFRVNEETLLFPISDKSDRELQDEYHVGLINFVAEAEQERIRMEKLWEEEQRHKEEERLKRASIRGPKISPINLKSNRNSHRPPVDIVDIRTPEHIKSDDERRTQRLNAGYNPDRWNDQTHIPPLPETKTKAVEDKKRIKFITSLNTKRFQGDAYIKTPSEVWKQQLFDLYEKEPSINAEVALKRLQQFGVKLTQSENLVQYTIDEALSWMERHWKIT